MPGEITTDMAPETNAGRVLALPTTRADGLALAKLFGANQIAFTICASMPQLCAAQRAGAGLLIVTGKLLMKGNPSFKGLILVMGEGYVERDGGGNGNI